MVFETETIAIIVMSIVIGISVLVATILTSAFSVKKQISNRLDDENKFLQSLVNSSCACAVPVPVTPPVVTPAVVPTPTIPETK